MLRLRLRYGRFAESSKLFRQKSLASHAVLSSVNMQSLNSFFALICQCKKRVVFLYSRRASSDSSVYSSGPIQPIRRRSLLIRLMEMSSFSCIRFCSSLPLISRSALTTASMKASATNPSLRLLLTDTIRYNTMCYFNVRSKADGDMSQLSVPHGTNN